MAGFAGWMETRLRQDNSAGDGTLGNEGGRAAAPAPRGRALHNRPALIPSPLTPHLRRGTRNQPASPPPPEVAPAAPRRGTRRPRPEGDENEQADEDDNDEGSEGEGDEDNGDESAEPVERTERVDGIAAHRRNADKQPTAPERADVVDLTDAVRPGVPHTAEERMRAILHLLDETPVDQQDRREEIKNLLLGELTPGPAPAAATPARFADISKLCVAAAGAAPATKVELRLPSDLWTRVNQHIALALGPITTEGHRVRSFMLWLDSKDQCEELKTAYQTWKQLHGDLAVQIAEGTTTYPLTQLQKNLELHIHGTRLSTDQLFTEIFDKAVPASYSAFAQYIAKFKTTFMEAWTASLGQSDNERARLAACKAFYQQITKQPKVFDALRPLIVNLSQESTYKDPELVDIYNEVHVEKLCRELHAVEDRERQAKKVAASASATTSSTGKQEKRRLNQHGGDDFSPRHKKNGGNRNKDSGDHYRGKRARDGPPPDDSGWCTYIERDSAGAVLRDHSQFAHTNAACSKQRSTYSSAAPAAATSASSSAPPLPSAPYSRGVGALGPRLPKK